MRGGGQVLGVTPLTPRLVSHGVAVITARIKIIFDSLLLRYPNFGTKVSMTLVSLSYIVPLFQGNSSTLTSIPYTIHFVSSCWLLSVGIKIVPKGLVRVKEFFTMVVLP